jgi:putative ABC transport system substrate-binding protein
MTLGRREFITLVGGTAAVWPLAVRAQAQQTGGVPRIGALLSSNEGDVQVVAGLAALRKALAELGYTDGRNIRIDYRFGAAEPNRIQALAGELIALRPHLFFAAGTPAVAALQRETKTTPIVFVTVSDPVGSGFVASLPRPSGNITGFINIEDSVSGKWIEILKDLVPGATTATLMYNPDTAPYFEYYLQPFETAARSGGLEPMAAPAHTTEDIEGIVASLGSRGGGGLAITPDSFLQTRRNLDLIIVAAARYRVPTIYPYRFCVAAGGLISYGIDIVDLYRRSAVYIDRILKGSKPADLPVQLPTKFELAVNLTTAKALGVSMSREFLFLADEVLE